MRTLKYSSISYNSLEHNSPHQFAARHALRIFRSNAIYTFIPKNACSTLRLSLAVSNGCIEYPTDFNWIHENNSTFQADLPSLASAQYTFTVLRCPFKRLASFYLDKIVNKDREAWNYRDLKRRSVELDQVSFRDFVQSLTEPRIRIGEIHWRPQVDFLVYKKYDDYFCLEQFPDAIETLQEKIALTVIDARPLTKHGIERFKLISNDNYSTIPSAEIREIQSSGQCPTPKSLYTDDLVQLVASLYKLDCDLYKSLFGNDDLLFKV